MFAKQQTRSPSPTKLSAPTSEQGQPETQPQSEPQPPGQSCVSSEFSTAPVGKRKVSALDDSGVSEPQGSPTKKPRLGSTSPRKGGPSPTVSICLSHATLTLLPTVARNQRVDKPRASPISLQGKLFHSCPTTASISCLVPFAPQSRFVFECNHSPPFAMYQTSYRLRISAGGGIVPGKAGCSWSPLLPTNRLTEPRYCVS
jgi:hypothetical protein